MFRCSFHCCSFIPRMERVGVHRASLGLPTGLSAACRPHFLPLSLSQPHSTMACFAFFARCVAVVVTAHRFSHLSVECTRFPRFAVAAHNGRVYHDDDYGRVLFSIPKYSLIQAFSLLGEIQLHFGLIFYSSRV